MLTAGEGCSLQGRGAHCRRGVLTAGEGCSLQERVHLQGRGAHFLARLFLASGGHSTEPIAPPPSDGINPIIAKSAVRTAETQNITHYSQSKHTDKDDSLLQDGCHSSG